MPRVVHFEIHADDLPRAAKFYEAALGWSFYKWDGPMEYWLITTGPDSEPGINAGLMPRLGAVEGKGMMTYICTVDVPAIDEYSQRILNAGGENCKPKMAVPGIGWLAYFKDTEGNVFGIMQKDPTAK